MKPYADGDWRAALEVVRLGIWLAILTDPSKPPSEHEHAEAILEAMRDAVRWLPTNRPGGRG